MNTSHKLHLLHPVFIGALILLLLNDHYLKEAFGNWWTGKLSDFAGVLLLPFFWKALFGGSNRTAILVTVGFFTWWKLPVSQPVIDGLNALTGFGFGRVVDATDLMALAFLPVSWWCLSHPIKISAPAHRRPRRMPALLLPLTLFALVATSAPDDDLFLFDGSTIDCCQQASVELRVDGGSIHLPSAFSPDFDGINDVFQIIPGDSGIAVDSLLIYTLDDNRLVYERADITSFDPLLGFDGEVSDTIVPQTYRYVVWHPVDGASVSYTGYVCALPCASPSGEPLPRNLGNCVFATQYVAGQGFDPNAESFEEQDDCFD